MRTPHAVLSALLAAASLALLLAPPDAAAIPAFARRYRVSCTTCHAPVPRLKPYGEEFAGRGFAMEPGQEPSRATLDVGDDLLQLPREFPIAVRFDGFVDWAPDRDPQVDFQTPFVFKALAGGQIAERVSYYTYFIIENGGEAMGIEDAWVQFSTVFGLPLDVVVGQFQICDPIVKRELRLTREDYEILRVTPGLSTTNLTYDRGLILGWHGPAELDVQAMLTNGNGIGPGTSTFDDDRYKTGSLRAAIPVGPVRIGLFGSMGKALGPTTGMVNTTVYWGPDLRVMVGENLTVSGQWLSRSDSNAFFDPANPGTIETRGGWLEAIWLPGGPNGTTSVALLGNKVVSDDPAARRESAGLQDACEGLLGDQIRQVLAHAVASADQLLELHLTPRRPRRARSPRRPGRHSVGMIRQGGPPRKRLLAADDLGCAGCAFAGLCRAAPFSASASSGVQAPGSSTVWVRTDSRSCEPTANE